MGLFSFGNWLRRWRKDSAHETKTARRNSETERRRRCFFEPMEDRRMLAAVPVVIGATYHEMDSGADAHGDTFEIKFEGGAPGTQLTRLVINGDHGPAGYSAGDMMFDTVKGGYGADEAHPFTVISQTGIGKVTASVEDGGMVLVLNFEGFEAGEKLVFSIDVDEIQDFDPNEKNIDIINEGIDPIASGVEFQESILTATFSAPNYYNVTGNGSFRNVYDRLFDGTGLLISATNPDGLPNDNYNNMRDRSTGVAFPLQQLPVPASISGYVYHDANDNGLREAGENGLGGVSVRVIPISTIEPQNAITVTTDVNGFYKVDGLMPGTYRVIEVNQPNGYFDGKDTAGTVNSITVGAAVNPGDNIENVALAGGQVGIEYNFGELGPASLRGNVRLADSDGNCDGPLSKPLPDVVVRLYDAAGILVKETKTDVNGDYEFTNLRPGIYKVVETTPSGLIDHDEHVGTAGGVLSDDTVSNIKLGSFQNATGYDFCELPPSTLSGYVYHDQNSNGHFDLGETPIAGVMVVLRDSQGNQVGTQTTNASGFYKFTGLSADTYIVTEVQPTGWLDGLDAAGTVNNVAVGQAVNPGDRIQQVALKWGQDGVDYDFGELKPGSIEGMVFVDNDGDCDYTTGDAPLGGVTVQLLNAQGAVIGSTVTDSNGRYKFDNLVPGTYAVREIQPDGYFQGGQSVGSGGGVASEDLLSQIKVGSDQHFVEYNFCELPPGSIEGMVFSDPDEDCEFGMFDTPLEGVVIQLLNDHGMVIATTMTDVNGHYKFDGLGPGMYSVHEIQPGGYFQGGQKAGSGGGVESEDLISQIMLHGGENFVHYDFCEVPPASVEGIVWVDPDMNCYPDPGEVRLAGVTIRLFNESGQLVATTTTDANGHYKFDNLRSGYYTLRETQPDGYFQGCQVAGSHGGDDSVPDVISQVPIFPSDQLFDYNFAELPPGSISGMVEADLDEGCLEDGDETPLEGVIIHLLDSTGKVIRSTKTDAEGMYHFDNLPPGTYTLVEEQPQDYFNNAQSPGSVGGDGSLENVISNVVLQGGVHAVNYDFCELPPSLLSGYVFQDGLDIHTEDGLLPQNIFEIRDGIRKATDKPIAGVVLELRNGLTGEAIMADEALPGVYASGPIRVTTDANGHYQFAGLRGGRSYAVFEIQPASYIDSLDTPGTTNGIAFNRNQVVPEFVISTLSVNPKDDAIVRIPLGVGVASEENNFSEVRVTKTPLIPPPPEPPKTFADPLPPAAIIAAIPPALPPIYRPLNTPEPPPPDGGHGIEVTWHLSVIDAGKPRGPGLTPDPGAVAFGNVSLVLGKEDWTSEKMQIGRWTVFVGEDLSDGQVENKEHHHEFLFGIRNGIPITGDFNGDGLSEVGVFYQGEWFIDLNGNGVWDHEDLWAKLGGEHDLPVTGDWNGDGKDDIGIFGPEWHGDPRAIAAEPGLPDLSNTPKTKPKNLPPEREEATDGHRLLKLTQQGRPRADLIDHVFRYGKNGDTPITGDWDGDGIDSIGIFRDGEWLLDVNGDGHGIRDGVGADVVAHFGQAGDIPVVGDFDGDGVDEIGVFRDGTWIIDTNHNREMDAHDRVFQLGGRGDRPVVGDWNGDGVDEPGIYREGEPPAHAQARKP